MTIVNTVVHADWRELARRVRDEVGQVDALIVDAFNRLNQKTIDRFWSRIREDGECWIWTAGVDQRFGYGRFALTTGHRPGSGKPTQIHLRAHRLSWALATSTWPAAEAYLLHSCDRPACCNPAHLRPGTQKDNIRDMDSRGRRGLKPLSAYLRGTKHPNCKMSDDDMRSMLEMRSLGAKHKEIAARFGVSHSTVGAICRGKYGRKVA